jgi:hypothetical protein
MSSRGIRCPVFGAQEKEGEGLTVTARSVFLFGSGAALTWALMYLLHQFVLLTEPTARAGLF